MAAQPGRFDRKWSNTPDRQALLPAPDRQGANSCAAVGLRHRNFSSVDAYGQMGVYTARMLNGAKLADLPCRAIEQARSGH